MSLAHMLHRHSQNTNTFTLRLDEILLIIKLILYGNNYIHVMRLESLKDRNAVPDNYVSRKVSFLYLSQLHASKNSKNAT